MAVIAIPRILREKLSDEGTEALVELLNKSNEKSEENTLNVAEGKFENRLIEVKSELEVKIEQVKSELEIKIEQVKSELEIKIEQVKSELEIKIERTKTELIRWMFIFWIGQIGVITTLLALFRTH